MVDDEADAVAAAGDDAVAVAGDDAVAAVDDAVVDPRDVTPTTVMTGSD
ncbi:hypothetical protein [Haloarchaeobius baliensis]